MSQSVLKDRSRRSTMYLRRALYSFCGNKYWRRKLGEIGHRGNVQYAREEHVKDASIFSEQWQKERGQPRNKNPFLVQQTGVNNRRPPCITIAQLFSAALLSRLNYFIPSSFWIFASQQVNRMVKLLHFLFSSVPFSMLTDRDKGKGSDCSCLSPIDQHARASVFVNEKFPKYFNRYFLLKVARTVNIQGSGQRQKYLLLNFLTKKVAKRCICLRTVKIVSPASWLLPIQLVVSSSPRKHE